MSLDVYHSLLDLAARTEKELGDPAPRDRIDVQSFIWVVGDYNDETEAPNPDLELSKIFLQSCFRKTIWKRARRHSHCPLP